jgi:hypothetical protein
MLDKVCKTFIGGSIPPRASNSFAARPWFVLGLVWFPVENGVELSLVRDGNDWMGATDRRSTAR